MKEDSKVWLHRLFNSNCFDIWQLASYLYRYPEPGIQYYLLNILRTKSKSEISSVLPQLVHIYKTTETNYILQEFLVEQGIEAYFLLENDKDHINEEIVLRHKKRRKMLRGKIRSRNGGRMNYTTFPCPIIPHYEKSPVAIQGLILIMTSAVSSLFDIGLAKKLKDYHNSFRLRGVNKGQKKTSTFDGTFFRSSFSTIVPSIRFFRELVNISKRLKCLPKSIRQRGLEIEIELMNSNLPSKIHFISNERKFVVQLVSEFSYVLDSAENSPYFLIFEVVGCRVRKVENIQNDVLREELVQFDVASDMNETGSSVSLDSECVSQLVDLKNDKVIEKETIYDNSSIRRPPMDLNELINASRILHKLYDLESKMDIPIEELNIIKEKIVANLKTIKTNENIEKMTWDEKIEDIRENSVYKDVPGHEIICAIIKRGSDIRQEVIALQLLKEMDNIFQEEKLNIFLKTYKVFLIDNKSAWIEAITNAESIHSIKKKDKTMLDFFKRKFKDADYDKAINNFLYSLVGYSLATYFLQVKDRHNGNILIDNFGYIIHVDFGFILGSHPGFYNVERAPFKFSTEYNDILGDKLGEFKGLFHEGFLVLRRNSDRLCRILEVFCEKSQMKMLNKSVLEAFRERFKLSLDDRDVEKWVTGLISWSVNSMGTGLYDSYQYFSHGYLK